MPPAFDIVALASSAGGITALSKILSALPAEFPAAIVLVQHLYPNYPSYLADILSQRTSLRVKQAEDGEIITSGTVYIAVPNKHLLINSDKTLFFSNAEKVNFVRPAANLLFESVAIEFKERAIAVVLTGKDGDGAQGVQAIKKKGGIVIAQDRETSEFFSMPKAAIDTGAVDFIVSLNKIAPALISLVSTGVIA